MLDQIAKDIAATVRESVQSGIKAVMANLEPRFKAIDDRFAALPVPKDGKDGIDGKSVSAEELLPVIRQMVDDIELPQAKDGEPGKDGQSVTIDDVRPIIQELVDQIEIPIPQDGKDGQSVSLDDVQPLIDNAVKAAVAEIPLPKDGSPGKDADPVDMAEIEKLVAAAVEKAIAKIHVPEPRNGIDGKDALDIEILPEIEQEKSYSRNTYAIHKGGLWRSYERTKGMRGWETVIDGIADIKIDYDGERGVKITTEKSSGEVVAKEFTMPMIIDRGVYKDGSSYAKNDGVTFAGSYWIAQKDEAAGKPGDGNSDFRLAVKRGRDAVPKVKVGN